MSIAKVIELSAESKKSFDDAIASGVARATKTVKDVQGAWVKSMKVDVANGKIVNYRVVMKVTFVLHD
ncbi:MAG TPA: dodecin family protein [Gemmatimonadales bacterium]|jgi:flavin-binding protein dodecin|nr:dodecin family protein [Gemmatimonadales bacterium]